MFQLCIALYFAQEFVKNCERSGILPCKLKHKLACYCFLDAGRRHKTRGLETKDFIIRDTAINVNIMLVFPVTPCPTLATQRGLGGYFANNEFVSHLRNELEEFSPFYSKTTLCSRKTCYIFPKVASRKHRPEKWPR